MENCRLCWARLFCNACMWDVVNAKRTKENQYEFIEKCKNRKELLATFLLSFGKSMEI